MYDIRQFRPALYCLLILGITGFALAARAPALWLLATGLILLNLWLVSNGRFTPMPRWLANIITVLLALFVARQARFGGSTALGLAIGHFLVLLQLVKLYEQRANRDFAQLLVLSLLMMVSAVVNTASLIFGVIFIIYLLLSLYCCLLFHLKMEADAAKSTLAESQQKVTPATLRQDQRYLSRSMRRLTGLVSSVSISTALLIFLFFPRGTPGGLFGAMQFRPVQTLTGFSDTVSFQEVARITQNDEKVAEVKVLKNNRPVTGAEPLVLRGITLDIYDNDWRWKRSMPSSPAESLSAGTAKGLMAPVGKQEIKQSITLRPTGTKVLFAVAGPLSFIPARMMTQVAFADDWTIQNMDAGYQTVDYTVISCGVQVDYNTAGNLSRYPEAARRSYIDAKIAELARQTQVSGADGRGPLFARRGNVYVSALDETIAANIERYLRSSFTYTLDLTDARGIMQGQDPIVAFLYDIKRGHCEYFAGAMTLLCQSLGMQARMVVGFKCDEFNSVGGFYQVRQSHAHAWVEVLTADGSWKMFDPTSGRESARNLSLWMRARHLFDFLEYKWASYVVAYDAESRDNLVERVNNRLVNTASRSNQRMNDIANWFEGEMFITLSSKLLGALIGFMVFALFVAVAWFLLERWRLRRRALRIGLDSLPAAEQLRLARQLGFYADLMALLERRQLTRPRHMTPMEFSRSLSFLPADVYRSIQRLTRIFYRIRFGDYRLETTQQRRLASVIARLSSTLPSTPS